MKQIPEFTEEIDIDEWLYDATSYIEKVRLIREQLSNDRILDGSVRVLPSQSDKCFHVVLQTDGNELTLRLKFFDLYVYGYKAQNTWYEFGKYSESTEHLIENSHFLGFRENYNDLEGLSTARQHMTLTPSKIRHSVLHLVEKSSYLLPQKGKASDGKPKVKYNDYAEALLAIIQSIAESVRFKSVISHITLPSGGSGVPPSPLPIELVIAQNGWSCISEAMVTYHHKEQWILDLVLQQKTKLNSIAKAIENVAVIKWRKPKDIPKVEGQTVVVGGQSEVQMNGSHFYGKHGPSLVTGNFEIRDGMGSREVSGSQQVSGGNHLNPGDSILVNVQPESHLSDVFSIFLNMDVANRVYSQPLHEGRRQLLTMYDCICGHISWHNFTESEEDSRPMFAVIHGDSNMIIMPYTKFLHALQASVEVEYQGEAPLWIYGMLLARDKLCKNESVLWHRRSRESMLMMPKQQLMLIRYMIIVPIQSSLMINADIRGIQVNVDRFKRVGVGKGPVTIPAGCNKEIDLGLIRLRVSWK